MSSLYFPKAALQTQISGSPFQIKFGCCLLGVQVKRRADGAALGQSTRPAGLAGAESNTWMREWECGEVSHRSPWILLCLQAGSISFYLVETTGLMANGAAVCIPAGLNSGNLRVCKGSWNNSEIFWILWMRMIENFTLVLPLHGCSCRVAGATHGSVPAWGIWILLLGWHRDTCGMSSTWSRCEVFQTFQARPGLGWVTAQGNVVKG